MDFHYHISAKPKEEEMSNTQSRNNLLIFATAISFWTLLFLGIYFIPLINTWMKIGIFLMLFAKTIPLFVVIVPEVTGLTLFNVLKQQKEQSSKESGTTKYDVLVPIGPGIRLKFPWEIVKKENYFSLELVTEEFSEDYAAQDGPLMKVKVSYQYWPDQNKLHRFIAVEDKTIKKGLKDILSSILSQVIAEKPAKEARKEIKEIEHRVAEIFDGYNMVNDQKLKEKVENQYGINFKIFTIPDIDYPDDYQATISGQARMAVFTETAKTLKSSMDISGKEATNVVLLEQGKGTKKNVVDIEGLPDIIKNLKGLLRGGN